MPHDVMQQIQQEKLNVQESGNEVLADSLGRIQQYAKNSVEDLNALNVIVKELTSGGNNLSNSIDKVVYYFEKYKSVSKQATDSTNIFRSSYDGLGSRSSSQLKKLTSSLQEVKDIQTELGSNFKFSATDNVVLLTRQISKLKNTLKGLGNIELNVSPKNLPKFQTGGKVTGGPSSGDKILARLNAGQYVFNKRQMSNLGRLLGQGKQLSHQQVFKLAGGKPAVQKQGQLPKFDVGGQATTGKVDKQKEKKEKERNEQINLRKRKYMSDEQLQAQRDYVVEKIKERRSTANSNKKNEKDDSVKKVYQEQSKLLFRLRESYLSLSKDKQRLIKLDESKLDSIEGIEKQIQKIRQLDQLFENLGKETNKFTSSNKKIGNVDINKQFKALNQQLKVATDSKDVQRIVQSMKKLNTQIQKEYDYIEKVEKLKEQYDERINNVSNSTSKDYLEKAKQLDIKNLSETNSVGHRQNERKIKSYEEASNISSNVHKLGNKKGIEQFEKLEQKLNKESDERKIRFIVKQMKEMEKKIKENIQLDWLVQELNEEVNKFKSQSAKNLQQQANLAAISARKMPKGSNERKEQQKKVKQYSLAANVAQGVQKNGNKTAKKQFEALNQQLKVATDPKDIQRIVQSMKKLNTQIQKGQVKVSGFQNVMGGVKKEAESMAKQFNEFFGGTPIGLAAVAAGIMLIGQQIKKLADNVANTVVSMSKMNVQMDVLKRTSTNAFGSSGAIQAFRNQMVLTRQQIARLAPQMVDFATKGNKSLTTLTTLAENLKNSLGELDVATFEKMMTTLKDLPQQQIQVLMGVNTDSLDKLNTYENLMKSGKISDTIQIYQKGGFGEVEGEQKIDQGSKQVVSLQRQIKKQIQDIKYFLFGMLPDWAKSGIVIVATIGGIAASIVSTMLGVFKAVGAIGKLGQQVAQGFSKSPTSTQVFSVKNVDGDGGGNDNNQDNSDVDSDNGNNSKKSNSKSNNKQNGKKPSTNNKQNGKKPSTNNKPNGKNLGGGKGLGKGLGKSFGKFGASIKNGFGKLSATVKGGLGKLGGVFKSVNAGLKKTIGMGFGKLLGVIGTAIEVTSMIVDVYQQYKDKQINKTKDELKTLQQTSKNRVIERLQKGLSVSSKDYGYKEKFEKQQKIKKLEREKEFGTTGGWVGGALLGATIGAVIPGFGSIIGAGIGAAVGATVGILTAQAVAKATEQKKKMSDLLQKIYSDLDASYEKNRENQQRERKKVLTDLRYLRDIEATLKQVKEGVYSAYFDKSQQVAQAQMGWMNQVGGSDEHYKHLQNTIVHHSQKSMQANMDALNYQFKKITEAKDMSGQAKLTAYNNLQLERIKILQQFVSTVQKSIGDYQKIPSVILNNIIKKINDYRMENQTKNFVGTNVEFNAMVKTKVDKTLENQETILKKHLEDFGRIDDAKKRLELIEGKHFDSLSKSSRISAYQISQSKKAEVEAAKYYLGRVNKGGELTQIKAVAGREGRDDKSYGLLATGVKDNSVAGGNNYDFIAVTKENADYINDYFDENENGTYTMGGQTFNKKQWKGMYARWRRQFKNDSDMDAAANRLGKGNYYNLGNIKEYGSLLDSNNAESYYTVTQEGNTSEILRQVGISTDYNSLKGADGKIDTKKLQERQKKVDEEISKIIQGAHLTPAEKRQMEIRNKANGIASKVMGYQVGDFGENNANRGEQRNKANAFITQATTELNELLNDTNLTTEQKQQIQTQLDQIEKIKGQISSNQELTSVDLKELMNGVSAAINTGFNFSPRTMNVDTQLRLNALTAQKIKLGALSNTGDKEQLLKKMELKSVESYHKNLKNMSEQLKALPDAIENNPLINFYKAQQDVIKASQMYMESAFGTAESSQRILQNGVKKYLTRDTQLKALQATAQNTIESIGSDLSLQTFQEAFKKNNDGKEISEEQMDFVKKQIRLQKVKLQLVKDHDNKALEEERIRLQGELSQSMLNNEGIRKMSQNETYKAFIDSLGVASTAILKFGVQLQKQKSMGVMIIRDAIKNYSRIAETGKIRTVGKVMQRKQSQSNLMAYDLNVEGFSALMSQLTSDTENRYEMQKEEILKLQEINNKSFQDMIAKAQQQLEQMQKSGQPADKIEEKKVEIQNLKRQASLNNEEAQKRLAESQLKKKQDVVKYAQQQRDLKLKILDYESQSIEIQRDLASSIGAPLQTVLSLEQQMVDNAKKKLQTEQAILDYYIEKGIQGQALKEQEVRLAKQQAEVIKNSMGAQRSALQKLMGNVFGQFTKFSWMGTSNKAKIFGQGYMETSGGMTVSTGGVYTGGYQSRVASANANGGVDPLTGQSYNAGGAAKRMPFGQTDSTSSDTSAKDGSKKDEKGAKGTETPTDDPVAKAVHQREQKKKQMAKKQELELPALQATIKTSNIVEKIYNLLVGEFGQKKDIPAKNTPTTPTTPTSGGTTTPTSNGTNPPASTKDTSAKDTPAKDTTDTTSTTSGSEDTTPTTPPTTPTASGNEVASDTSATEGGVSFEEGLKKLDDLKGKKQALLRLQGKSREGYEKVLWNESPGFSMIDIFKSPQYQTLFSEEEQEGLMTKVTEGVDARALNDPRFVKATNYWLRSLSSDNNRKLSDSTNKFLKLGAYQGDIPSQLQFKLESSGIIGKNGVQSAADVDKLLTYAQENKGTLTDEQIKKLTEWRNAFMQSEKKLQALRENPTQAARAFSKTKKGAMIFGKFRKQIPVMEIALPLLQEQLKMKKQSLEAEGPKIIQEMEKGMEGDTYFMGHKGYSALQEEKFKSFEDFQKDDGLYRSFMTDEQMRELEYAKNDEDKKKILEKVYLRAKSMHKLNQEGRIQVQGKTKTDQKSDTQVHSDFVELLNNPKINKKFNEQVERDVDTAIQNGSKDWMNAKAEARKLLGESAKDKDVQKKARELMKQRTIQKYHRDVELQRGFLEKKQTGFRQGQTREGVESSEFNQAMADLLSGRVKQGDQNYESTLIRATQGTEGLRHYMGSDGREYFERHKKQMQQQVQDRRLQLQGKDPEAVREEKQQAQRARKEKQQAQRAKQAQRKRSERIRKDRFIRQNAGDLQKILGISNHKEMKQKAHSMGMEELEGMVSSHKGERNARIREKLNSYGGGDNWAGVKGIGTGHMEQAKSIMSSVKGVSMGFNPFGGGRKETQLDRSRSGNNSEGQKQDKMKVTIQFDTQGDNIVAKVKQIAMQNAQQITNEGMRRS